MSGFALVGDVGGTNARIALCNLETGEVQDTVVYSAVENESLEGVLKAYMSDHAEHEVKQA